ncbi:hypothetical protein A2801_04185 [Candidatus Woesebacteria bacterium RIFCSPHIGHO2_01_FULL_41_10]|uniref:Zinc-ribbon domain-containing protein n=1 Tax=Candidatus Woesebacteria bacterium RIFCSPHIGHO2_01_FULL_41_10 TaxID=1802500 RepID=A0A1F7YMT3_9BACT|nr:MAG: hypothetical protein A2801_04185 [Candidatus Woesebacteria bacterium RIFCSPHIGHO2_01_FULL_41_10]
MNEILTASKVCLQCHIPVRETDYFCFNCGKALREKPKPVSIVSQVLLYTGCLFLPPLGFWWGYKYLKQGDETSKRIGIVAIVLTFIALILGLVVANNLMKEVTRQVNDATLDFMGI